MARHRHRGPGLDQLTPAVASGDADTLPGRQRSSTPRRDTRRTRTGTPSPLARRVVALPIPTTMLLTCLGDAGSDGRKHNGARRRLTRQGGAPGKRSHGRHPRSRGRLFAGSADRRHQGKAAAANRLRLPTVDRPCSPTPPAYQLTIIGDAVLSLDDSRTRQLTRSAVTWKEPE